MPISYDFTTFHLLLTKSLIESFMGFVVLTTLYLHELVFVCSNIRESQQECSRLVKGRIQAINTCKLDSCMGLYLTGYPVINKTPLEVGVRF